MDIIGSKSSSKRVRKFREKSQRTLRKHFKLSAPGTSENRAISESSSLNEQINFEEEELRSTISANLLAGFQQERQFEITENVENLEENNQFGESTDDVVEAYELTNNSQNWSPNDFDNSDESDNYANNNSEYESDNNVQDVIPEDNEPPEVQALREWAVVCRTPNNHLDLLLAILRKRLLPELPKCSKTFLHTTEATYEVKTMIDGDNLPGEYAYLGLKSGLESCINVNLHTNNLIELDFNIDGVKLQKSSPKTFWPVLCKVYYDPDIYKPFAVCAFYGNGKPKSMKTFMKPFVLELNELLSSGISIQAKQFSIRVRCFICDLPARAGVKCVKGHMAFDGSERCDVKGERVENTTVFLGLDCRKRTGEGFRQFTYLDHHNSASPLLAVNPPLDLVKQFILDPMHMLYLGVMARLFECWMTGNADTKLSASQKTELNRRSLLIKKDIPYEFHRKMRSTNFYDKYKAVELRFFLLYCSPIILKKILKDEVYNHLLQLHIACRLLSGANSVAYVDQARDYLKSFVETAQIIYGQRFITLNVHNLIHLADDVENFQSDLSSISAFPYENELGKIKNILHSPYRKVAQYCRQAHVHREIINQVPELPKELYVIKESVTKGILKISYKQNLYTTKHPDNTVLLNNGIIARINEFTCANDSIFLKITTYKIIKSIYTNPCDSSLLNCYEIKEDIRPVSRCTDIKNVRSKLIKFSLNFSEHDNQRIYVVPLTH